MITRDLAAWVAEHALGIVLSETAGNMQFHSNGAWTKRSQVGHPSASGLTAAVLANHDAAIALRDEESVDFDSIERVEVGLPRAPLDLISLLAEPASKKREPVTTVDGQFSIYFCVAVGLRLGRLAWDDCDTQFTRLVLLEVESHMLAVESPEKVLGEVNLFVASRQP